MTHYDKAKQSVQNMSITIAFCIAAYLEQCELLETEEEMVSFMQTTSEDIKKWLVKEESDGVKGEG